MKKSDRLDVAGFYATATGRLGWTPEAFWRSTPEAVILAAREHARARVENEALLTRVAGWIVAPWAGKLTTSLTARADELMEIAGHVVKEAATLTAGGSAGAFKGKVRQLQEKAAEALLAED